MPVRQGQEDMRLSFVCFSFNNWEKRWARKQQFMYHLVKHGSVDKVLYIEPALSLIRLFTNLFSELASEENRARWKRALFFKTLEYRENLFIFTPLFFIPLGRMPLFHRINRFITLGFVHLKISRLNLKNIVLWLYNPYDYPVLKWFKNRIICCFDWAEEWAEYLMELSLKRREKLRMLELLLAKDVDVVFTVSQKLSKKAKEVNRHSYFLPSGTDMELFERTDDDPILEDITYIKKPIVGYIGTITERMDLELLEFLAITLPDYSFVFIGDIHYSRVDISRLINKKNFHFLGGKRYQDLPAYLRTFDVCIIPYIPEITEGEPTKIYDYFASGKPIVSTPLVEVLRFKDYIKIAETKEKFVRFVQEGVREKDPELSELRIKVAKENSWAARAEQIIEIIKGYNGTKRSH